MEQFFNSLSGIMATRGILKNLKEQLDFLRQSIYNIPIAVDQFIHSYMYMLISYIYIHSFNTIYIGYICMYLELFS